ncbi:3-oxoacyl-ACP synthase III family protein [Butyrivibrio proteoclasticus]|uniref:3-oxoacyl-ACP synthase III family protein n=1 Tax=Butyrivibrio proteoclasticus TaxID=43305 RepID=UPI00047DABBA|nr:ketoacyl-ACP synthase III [Butyrivibrio proteoclasticus]
MDGERVLSKARIVALSTVIPEKKLSLQELAELYGDDYIERITKSTGIKEVTVAAEDKTSADYCYEAALKVLKETGLSPSDIDGLIFLSETPDYIIPNTAAILQERLGLPTNSVNFDMRLGCAGYVYGLFQASMMIECGYCKNVLFLAGDTMSKYTNVHDRSLKMVLGDAASATLISRSDNPTPSMYNFFVDGSGANSIIIPAGGCRMPIKHGVTDVLEYDADGNGRTLENVCMNGMDVMVFAINQAPKLINGLLESTGWSKDDVGLFALHQANKIIVDRIVKVLKIDKDKAPFNIEDTGNCGFVSIPLLLSTYYSGINSDLNKVIACGFGTGLIAAAAALDLSQTNIIKTFSV